MTVGLKRAGFRVVGAVELDPTARATYRANHAEVTPLKDDICEVKGKDVKALVDSRRIDLIAGCPPCQGFCSLTPKGGKKDPRNRLVAEFARLVRQVSPLAVMMENVPGLAQRGGAIFKDLLRTLDDCGYEVEYGVLQVANFGVPQRRRRLVLLAGKGFTISLPKPTHGREGKNGLPKWRTLRDAISGQPKPLTLTQAKRRGGPEKFNWHVVRDMSEENMRRIRHAKAGRSWRSIPKKLRPECHQDVPLGFQNAYGRMRWCEPSVTITGGCTTLSKGRFGHPQAHRTISVREAALLQTFPPDYEFATPYMDKVCEIIGNALPCDFAEILSHQCARAIREHEAGR